MGFCLFPLIIYYDLFNNSGSGIFYNFRRHTVCDGLNLDCERNDVIVMF